MIANKHSSEILLSLNVEGLKCFVQSLNKWAFMDVKALLHHFCIMSYFSLLIMS